MVTRNVTVDPAARATAVKYPEIEEVRSSRSGLAIRSVDLIEACRYDRLVRIRNRLREELRRDPPRLCCACCNTAVYLVSTPEKTWFFRHVVEDGSCPAVTRSALTEDEIRERKYHGARESDAHKRIKALVVRSAGADSRFSEVRAEQVWRAKDRDAWRRPDVQARLGDLRLAFEVQLNTTFISVIAGRRAFYRSQGALLTWVLPRFDPEDRRLTVDDICFPNNSNVLVVDEETTRLSERCRRFHARCHYREAYLDGMRVAERWQQRIVPIDELHLDLAAQHAWWFDFAGTRERLLEEAATLQRADEERRRAALEVKQTKLRDAFTEFWQRNGASGPGDADEDEQWARLRERFRDFEVPVPDNHKVGGFRTSVSALLSARLGRPVGFGFEKLVQVAHLLADAHRGLLVPFGYALRMYGTFSVVEREDRTRSWARKSQKIRAALEAHDPAYAVDLEWHYALCFLFPEIAAKLTKANASRLSMSSPRPQRAEVAPVPAMDVGTARDAMGGI